MPIYAQYEYIIEEMDGKQACTFQKNSTLFFWKFGVPNKHITEPTSINSFKFHHIWLYLPTAASC